MGLLPISIHGFPYIIALLLLSLLSLPTSVSLPTSKHLPFLIALTLFVTYFFRDPKRSVPEHDSLVLSPADGVVTSVSTVDTPLGDGSRLQRISIFLSVLNVHVNRAPVTGVVKSVEYRRGLFLSALKEESEVKNEMIRTVFQSKVGNHRIIMEQLAGLVARRVVCDLHPEHEVKLGSRMGIIKFGSRVNLYLPLEMKPMVSKGHKVVGGETILAHLDEVQTTQEHYKYNKV